MWKKADATPRRRDGALARDGGEKRRKSERGEIQEAGGARAAARTSMRLGLVSVTTQIGASTAIRLCAESEATGGGGAAHRSVSSQSAQPSVSVPFDEAARVWRNV